MNPTPIIDTKPKTVLLVEDEVSLREFLATRLTERGMKVSVASDGEEALAKMLKEKPDAVVMDVMLPKKNGFTVIDEFWAAEPKSSIHIILLTSLDDMQVAVQAMEKHAVGYIVKSDRSVDAVADLIEAQLTKRGASAA